MMQTLLYFFTIFMQITSCELDTQMRLGTMTRCMGNVGKCIVHFY